MSHRLFVSVIGVLVCAAAWASEPGQPLDCSDWVFVQPGLSCTTKVAADCSGAPYCSTNNGIDLTVEGSQVFLRLTPLPECCPTCGSPQRTQIVVFDGAQERVVAFIDDRCINVGVYGTKVDSIRPVGHDPAFQLRMDMTNGILLVPLRNSCSHFDPGGVCSYPGGLWLAAISGFTTMFEVLQSYVPSLNATGFRVPYMPEGMGSADYFDTYWGDLSSVGNWSQAHGLQCRYPAGPPARGDYLTVPDILPTPDPGHGYYYVTAATYQGQIRYGRKTAAGHVTGRDPALLPACSTEAQR